MPLLLQPARLRGPAFQARAVDRRMVPRVPRSQSARRTAARALGRRAHAAGGPGAAGWHCAWTGAIHVADHLGLPAHQGAVGRLEGSRARPRADQSAGRRRRAVRRDRRNGIVPGQDRGVPLHAGVGVSPDRQRGAAPPQSPPGRGSDPARRVARRRADRAGQHAVLRLGAPQPRHAHADQGPAGGGLAGGGTGARPPRHRARDRVGPPRLPRAVPQALHGRLGACVHDGHAGGRSLALPCSGPDHHLEVRERA